MPRRPSNGTITDPYGTRVNPITGFTETHHGEDIGADAGLLLVAPEDATIIAYGVQPGWEVHGRVCILQGASGWVHWLSHTDRLALDLGVGATLAEGDAAAYMGLTGQTTGLHVHWETRWQGVRLDPEGWLAHHATATSRTAPKEQPPMAFRLITSPFYRQAHQHVLTNGLDAFPIDDAVAVGLRAGGVPVHAYGEDDGLNPQQAEDAFNAEITLVHRFASNINTAAAERMADVFGARLTAK